MFTLETRPIIKDGAGPVSEGERKWLNDQKTGCTVDLCQSVLSQKIKSAGKNAFVLSPFRCFSPKLLFSLQPILWKSLPISRLCRKTGISGLESKILINTGDELISSDFHQYRLIGALPYQFQPLLGVTRNTNHIYRSSPPLSCEPLWLYSFHFRPPGPYKTRFPAKPPHTSGPVLIKLRSNFSDKCVPNGIDSCSPSWKRRREGKKLPSKTVGSKSERWLPGKRRNKLATAAVRKRSFARNKAAGRSTFRRTKPRLGSLGPLGGRQSFHPGGGNFLGKQHFLQSPAKYPIWT